MTIGFLGLGTMGRPMALNLVRSGVALTVWNRSSAAVAELVAAGATPASTPFDVFNTSETIIVMLLDEIAIDGVLDRASGRLRDLVPGRTVVNMSTVAPAYSVALEAEIRASGGCYVEAPVSGSRVPAEQAELVAMTAGQPSVVDRVTPLLRPMCAEITLCGPVPAGITMKLAVNTFLIALVTGLAEAFHFGQRYGLDLGLLRRVIDAGQMSSPISRVKTAKLVADDLRPQAAISNVLMNCRLIVEAATVAGFASPLLDVCRSLYADGARRGDSDIDMIGIYRAIADRGRDEAQAVQD
jgi:3-hydroxyisobutyrate dehydrogenase